MVQVRVERCPSAKAYLRLHTSLGDLNLELHCDLAPRAAENFLALAEGGYYSGTAFHRSIRNFMIQARRARLCGSASGGRVCLDADSLMGLAAGGCRIGTA